MEIRYEKLDRIRADIQKDREKVIKLQEQIKAKEAKLKEAESSQIVADVGAMNMTPEQLGEFLALIQSGKINSLLSGTKIETVSATEAADFYANEDGTTNDTINDDDMEDIEDDEN